MTTRLLLALTALGLLFRIGWLATAGREFFLKPAHGEAANVARSLALHGSFADAFGIGPAPTAHLSPASPMIAAGFYRLFGYATPLAEAMLTAWALGLVFLSFWLFYRVFERLGSPLPARLLGFAALALLPANFFAEIVNFRVWEGGLAAVLAGLFLLQVIDLDRRPQISTAQIWATGLLAALCLLVSPPTGVAAYLCGMLLMLRRLPARRYLPAALIVAACTGAVLAPWTIRNELVMGAPIPFRDNFGLEAALANYPGALDAPDRAAAFTRRFDQIHPTRPAGAAALEATGGERAYAAMLGRETKAWITAHPGAFVRLSLRHLTEFLLPPRWYWASPGSQTGSGSIGTWPKLIVHWAATLFGLAGIGYALARLRGAYFYVVLMTLVPILPYLLVQPILRYRTILFILLVYFACDGVVRLLGRRSPKVDLVPKTP